MQPKRFFTSLRFKITAGIALSLLIILSTFSYLQYLRARALLFANMDSATTTLGNVLVGSLQNAMLVRDQQEIQSILNNVTVQKGVRTAFLIDPRRVVAVAPNNQGLGQRYSLSDPGCVECHNAANSTHADSIVLTLSTGERVFRNCRVIVNQPPCQRCHGIQAPVNGVLITDLSMKAAEQSLSDEVGTNILWSAAVILATILVVNTLMSRMIVTKLERLVDVLKRFSRGDLSQRMRDQGNDEIGELATSFNRMAEGLGEKDRLEQQVLAHSRELQRLNNELRSKELLRRQLLAQVITAQEEERKRIARDLHDQLGQALSALTMGMEAAENALPPQREGLRERLLRAKTLAMHALEQTHEMIVGLRPVALDDFGLAAAMRSYAEQLLVPRDIETQVITHGSPRRLTPELEITLFRIVQEAINNVATHASARSVKLTLEFGEATVRLTVEDDGKGFDPHDLFAADGKRSGLGLLGMRERAELAEGTLTVDSQPGQGTRITVIIPTPAQE